MISKDTLEQLTLYTNNFIPESKEYGMPKASFVIDNNRLLSTLKNDEKFLALILNLFGEEFFTKEKINFDELILNKEILLNDDFVKIINPLLIELYFSSYKVQSILKNITNRLSIKDSSIMGGDFSLTNEVKMNFKN